MFIVDRDQRRIQDLPAGADHSKRAEREPERASPSNNNNNTLIYIAPACRMTSEALADSSSRATECLTEK